MCENATAPTTANFQVVYATGTPPKVDSGWGLEAALDIEWAHAMVPPSRGARAPARETMPEIKGPGRLIRSSGGRLIV